MEQPKDKDVKPEEKADEPALFDKSYMENDKQKKPPYIFVALIIFVILSFVWKGVMVDRNLADPKSPDATVEQGAEETPQGLTPAR